MGESLPYSSKEASVTAMQREEEFQRSVGEVLRVSIALGNPWVHPFRLQSMTVGNKCRDVSLVLV